MSAISLTEYPKAWRSRRTSRRSDDSLRNAWAKSTGSRAGVSASAPQGQVSGSSQRSSSRIRWRCLRVAPRAQCRVMRSTQRSMLESPRKLLDDFNSSSKVCCVRSSASAALADSERANFRTRPYSLRTSASWAVASQAAAAATSWFRSLRPRFLLDSPPPSPFGSSSRGAPVLELVSARLAEGHSTTVLWVAPDVPDSTTGSTNGATRSSLHGQGKYETESSDSPPAFAKSGENNRVSPV